MVVKMAAIMTVALENLTYDSLQTYMNIWWPFEVIVMILWIMLSF